LHLAEHWAEEAFRISSDKMAQLMGEVEALLKAERSQGGYREEMKITGGLVVLPRKGKIVVVGDLHGDLESLIHILRKSRFLERTAAGEDVKLIFLGDYGDRGPYSPEVYSLVLRLKRDHPERVILLRGNHEAPPDLLGMPHDLPSDFQRKFGSAGRDLYLSLVRLFQGLHQAVLVEGAYLLLHGGAPSQASTLKDLAYAHQTHPSTSHLEEILWSDPEDDIAGVYPSPRGAGRLFGEDVTARVLALAGAKVLIRGHQPCPEGVMASHRGKVLTLFSRKGPPYFNPQGAFLVLNPAQESLDARQLADSALKF